MLEHEAVIELFNYVLQDADKQGWPAKSPTQTLRTQSSHVFMAIYAAFKLQCLSIKTRINPFALRLKLLINASRSAYAELQQWPTAA